MLTKTERITFLRLLRVYTSRATSDRHHQTVKDQMGFFFGEVGFVSKEVPIFASAAVHLKNMTAKAFELG